MPWHTTSTHEITAYLLDRLGRTSVAYIAGARSRSLPARWAVPPEDSGHAEPSTDETRRLRAAYAIFTSIEGADNDRVAESWLLAANPRLDGATPIELIRNADYRAVYRAAKGFINDSYHI